MKIYKIRNKETNKYMDKKTYQKSKGANGGTTFKQLKIAKDHAREMKEYFKKDSFEVVEFELMETVTYEDF